ncbi:MAG: hypothetical protein H0V67_02385 [Geodermatophilaceae bacterium]|nr:hypothetical protein [Geodermatophilaceae bacterium]
MASRAAKSKSKLVEPTWFASDGGGPPLTELLAENQGALSPFGEDAQFPLPPSEVNYQHPTAKPNRAEYT